MLAICYLFTRSWKHLWFNFILEDYCPWDWYFVFSIHFRWQWPSWPWPQPEALSGCCGKKKEPAWVEHNSAGSKFKKKKIQYFMTSTVILLQKMCLLSLVTLKIVSLSLFFFSLTMKWEAVFFVFTLLEFILIFFLIHELVFLSN